MKYWFISLICLCAWQGVAQPSVLNEHQAPTTNKPVNIVVVLSYNPILPWSQNIVSGIAKASAQHPQKINIFIESLYVENQTINYLHSFIPSMEAKYKHTNIDAFVTDSTLSDLLFTELLNSTQFVNAKKFNFAFQNETIHQHDPRIENLQFYNIDAFSKHIDYIFTTLPNTREVYINKSTKGVFGPHMSALQKVQASEQYDFSVHTLQFDTVEIAQQQLEKLPENAIFIYLPVFTSQSGNNLTPKRFLQAIAPYSPVPMFSAWVTFMGDGIVGGYIFDPILQGQTMISVVLEELATGKHNNELPFSSWMFDQQQANKYGIPIPDHVLPEHVYNKDANILIDYPLETSLLLLLLAIMAVIVFWFRHIKLANAMKTVKLANIQAQENAIEATRSSQAKSKFLANISHEIRTPINGMFGVLNILGKTNLNSEQQNLMQMGRFCTDTLLRTVNDVLDFSKLESSQLQLKEIGFSPVQLLKESYAYGQLISEDKPLEIILEIDQLIDVPLLGDQIRIRQIFDNLISNAVKFTNTGLICIGATIRPDNNDYVLTCWVNDTGEGISEDDINKLFQPFVQIEDSYSKSRSGTGLGLALCKELVSLMQGQITMESILGTGTNIQFTLHLPLAENVMQIESEVIHVDLPRLQQAHILFVEDNPINQEITIVQLRHYGIEMTVLNNGKECLDHLLNTEINYDVILMDIQMPIMNGYDASVAIRNGMAGMHNQHIPIIALTAHVSLEEQQKALQAGMNKHINKPIVPEQLLKAIEECIIPIAGL